MRNHSQQDCLLHCGIFRNVFKKTFSCTCVMLIITAKILHASFLLKLLCKKIHVFLGRSETGWQDDLLVNSHFFNLQGGIAFQKQKVNGIKITSSNRLLIKCSLNFECFPADANVMLPVLPRSQIHLLYTSWPVQRFCWFNHFPPKHFLLLLEMQCMKYRVVQIIFSLEKKKTLSWQTIYSNSYCFISMASLAMLALYKKVPLL